MPSMTTRALPGVPENFRPEARHDARMLAQLVAAAARIGPLAVPLVADVSASDHGWLAAHAATVHHPWMILSEASSSSSNVDTTI
jgi:hypothetical protein